MKEGIINIGGPPYPLVTCSKTYCGCMELEIIPNAIYNVI
jgi:hypothetical protein